MWFYGGGGGGEGGWPGLCKVSSKLNDINMPMGGSWDSV